MYKRILVATDGSKLSSVAVNSGIDLAKLTGADMVIVKVIPRYSRSYFDGSIPLNMEELARVEKTWSEEGQAVVDAAKSRAAEQGVKAKGVTVKSDLVAEAIITTAKKHKVDLIVMASHGRRGLKRLLLGSETQQVLTHIDIPVLVLR